jgi:predicted MPP superfamily phosphohydrolase
MGKPLFSKEEYKILWEKYKGIRTIARAVGAGRNKVGADLKRYGINTKKPSPGVRLVRPSDEEIMYHAEKLDEPMKKPACGYDEQILKIVGHRVYDEKTVEELWDAVTEYQIAHNGQKTVCRKVEMTYGDDFLLVIFLADIHVGSESSELRLIRYHMKEIARRTNVVMILCGDYTDNFITFAQNQQLIQPTDQQKLLEYIINTIKDKVVACIRGNHDERDKNVVDKDLVEMTCKMANIPYLGAEGWIEITVREQLYRIYAAHQGKFNSSLNQTHTVKKAFETKGDFDIGVISHNHTGAIEQAPKWGLHRIYIRPGTYKIYDRYGINHGYGESEVCVPAVLLFGDRRQMIPFYNLEDALLILDLLQKEKK